MRKPWQTLHFLTGHAYPSYSPSSSSWLYRGLHVTGLYTTDGGLYAVSLRATSETVQRACGLLTKKLHGGCMIGIYQAYSTVRRSSRERVHSARKSRFLAVLKDEHTTADARLPPACACCRKEGLSAESQVRGRRRDVSWGADPLRSHS